MDLIDLTVGIAGVRLKNPVVTLSGTCGFGREYEPFYSPSDVGAIAVKGMTLEPRRGNGTPRIAETPSGMLNSIGLQNPGVRAFISDEYPRLKAGGATVIANIAGATEDDYVAVAELLAETDVPFVELNVSCPNVKHGGAAFGSDPAIIERLSGKVRAVMNAEQRLIVKLSPNVADITETARAAECGGADALSLINTLIGMRIDIKTRRPVLHNNVGGLSGRAVFPVAVRMVWQTSRAVRLPIIGMGGVATAEDAFEMMLAGASAVGVGTAMFASPTAPVDIVSGLESLCAEYGVTRVSDLTGAVKPW